MPLTAQIGRRLAQLCAGLLAYALMIGPLAQFFLRVLPSALPQPEPASA